MVGGGRVVLVLVYILVHTANGFVSAPAARLPSVPRLMPGRGRYAPLFMSKAPRGNPPQGNPLSDMLQNFFGRISSGRQWSGSRGVRRAELKSELARIVDLNQGRCAHVAANWPLEEATNMHCRSLNSF